MIILFAIMWFVVGTICGVVGYKTADIVIDLNYQRIMNRMRRELELPVKPYRVRFLTSAGV